MTWYLNETPIESFPDKAVGFVYLITTPCGRKYVGKKLLTKAKTKQVKGKKKKIRVESDWRDYYGSNDKLKEMVEKEGPENFKREILHICFSLSETSYLEAREQFDRRVMESNDYINEWIMYRGRKSQLKLSK
jgi:hypothetical protein